MATPSWFNEQYYLRSKLAQLNSGDTPSEYTTTAQVRQAIEGTGLTVYDHFQQFSLDEHTSPSQYFNTHEYLVGKAEELNADLEEGDTPWTPTTVAQAIKAAGYQTAWDHFNQYGMREGVSPSNNFDVDAYLEAKVANLQEDDPAGNWTLKKVIDAFEQAGLNPVSHYADHGRQEGLPAVPVAEADRVQPDPLHDVDIPGPDWFHEEHYLETKLAQLQADNVAGYETTEQVRDAIETAGLTLHEHFEQYSLVEGTSPSPYFNTTEYLRAKVDQLNESVQPGDLLWTVDTVKKAFADAGFTNAWQHYDEHGIGEGVNPSNGFDTDAYMAAKLANLQATDPGGEWTAEKVADAFREAGLNPVSHYEQHGENEGLAPQAVQGDDRVEPDPLKSGMFTVTNDSGQVSFANGSGNITFTLNGTVATFSRGEITDAANTVDFAQAGIRLNLAEGQTLVSNTADLTGVPVAGEGNLSLTNPATVAQVAPLDFDGVTGAVSYSLVDSIGNLSNAPDGLVEGATSVQANMHNGGETYIASNSAGATNKLTVQGGTGNDTFQATLDSPIAFPDQAPTVRQVENFVLQSTVAAAGLMMSRVTDAERITNNGSTQDLSVIDVGNAVELVASNVNPDQATPQDGGAWTPTISNFVVRYSDTDSTPENQAITLQNSNLSLLTVTVLGINEAGEQITTSAEIEHLSIISSGDDSNAIRTFNEGTVGLNETVRTVTITGDQDLTVIDLPNNAEIVDASTATGNLYLVFNGADGVALLGGSGNDTLYGGEGDDLIVGGGGADIMIGRGGSDTYIIATDEVTEGAADLVHEFATSGEEIDQIGFGTVGAVDFTKADAVVGDFAAALEAANTEFAGSDADVAVNAQQVGGVLWVFGDTDGNGQADAVVQLVGVGLESFDESNVLGAVAPPTAV